MFKIKKIYLKNFKGIKDKTIVEFNDKVTLLTGPNGFGKTTIFDVLEWCFTGQLYRVKQNEKVTNDTKDYLKPIFQNTVDEDVIIKLWINNGEKDLIIVRCFSKTHEGRSKEGAKKNKPGDFDLLQLYSSSLEMFDSDSFDFTKEQPLTQNEINSFFSFNNKDAKMEDLYKMFNYLQQEETTYFLKQSEKERKGELSFLFNTSDAEDKSTMITKDLKALGQFKKELDEKIKTIENTSISSEETYFSLFSHKPFDFDKEDPFKNMSTEASKISLDKYVLVLKNLNDFINKFSPKDFHIKANISKLDSILKNEKLIRAILFRKELKMLPKYKEQYEIFNDDNILKAFLLSDIENNYDLYREQSKKREFYENFLSLDTNDEKINKLKVNKNEYLEEENLKLFESYLKRIEELNKSSTVLSSFITELNKKRDLLFTAYKVDIEEITKEQCPYCGLHWETREKLDLAFKEKTQNLSSLLDDIAPKIKEIETEIIKNNIEPLEKRIKEYLDKTKRVNKDFLNYVESNKKIYEKVTKLKKIFDVVIVDVDLNSSVDELNKIISKLKESLKSQLLISPEIYNYLDEIKNIIITEQLEFLEKEFSVAKKEVILFTNNLEVLSLNDQLALFKKSVEEVKDSMKYREEAVVDEHNFYMSYFDSDIDNFSKINKGLIDKKISYLNSTYSLNSNKVREIYTTRLKKLETIIKNLTSLKEMYDTTIKKYKKEMVDAIKIPFFLYTAKILQNYQQGMGIFISTDETGSKNDSIRFITESSSDHDAIHHLSSGQLSVVALAFCLAVNKTYKISNNLKFLAIDDPIQEMDSLNVHSFIELIRNEFIDDYQIIFSTHNDNSAYYMKYKFEKYFPNSVKLINVQDEFFGTNEEL